MVMTMVKCFIKFKKIYEKKYSGTGPRAIVTLGPTLTPRDRSHALRTGPGEYGSVSFKILEIYINKEPMQKNWVTRFQILDMWPPKKGSRLSDCWIFKIVGQILME